MSRKTATTIEIASRAPASGQPSSWRMSGAALLIIYWVALAIGTHIPRVPQVLHLHTLWDKLLHFSGFCGLGYLMAVVWQLSRSREQPLAWRHLTLIVIVVSAYGGLDEVTQQLVGRNCELADWCADMLGATCGALCFAMSLLMLRRWWRPNSIAR